MSKPLRGNYDKAWNTKGDSMTWEDVDRSLLQEQRDLLKTQNGFLLRLVRILECPNFMAIPSVLQLIQRNTKKRKRATRRTR